MSNELLLLVFGAAIGAAAWRAWGDAMWMRDTNLAKREQKFLTEEIKRLRTQVANMIGVEKPTPCDAVHVGQNARGAEQAVCTQKAA